MPVEKFIATMKCKGGVEWNIECPSQEVANALSGRLNRTLAPRCAMKCQHGCMGKETPGLVQVEVLSDLSDQTPINRASVGLNFRK